MTGHAAPADIRAAHSRLRHWLLSAPVQATKGPHAGGIAGTLDADGRIAYVYAEITGYYLHWLASPGVHGLPGARRRAQAAADWAGRVFADSEPATRVYLRAHDEDWRNRSRFVFDLGMLAGGLAAAWGRGLVEPMPALAMRLQQLALDFIDQAGRLQAVAQPAGIERWSTLPGPFLAKPASRLLMLDALHPGAAALREACKATLAAWPARSLPGHVELHPALYHLEGLACGRTDPRGIAGVLERLLAQADAHGRLPETPGAAPRRCDVTAQALRLALWLRDAGLPVAGEALLARMAHALAEAVDADGGIGFRLDRPAPERNLWCAMFAEQAIAAWLQAQAGGACGLAADDIA